MPPPPGHQAGDLVDLRSDTVTRPSAPMRAAMAEAEVGDDVFGEDPTVNALQARAATLLGTEAALFVPSGSMANQIALLTHCRPGDDVLIGDGAHNYFYETGGGGALAGVQFTLVGRDGLYDAADAEAAIKPDNHHNAPTRLLCVENTHNRSGGRVWPLETLAELTSLARRHELQTHLDGARLFNAAAALNVDVAALAAGFDTTTFCLSKGLGAPVGSVLCGSRELIHRAHRFRKMLGGGMRQAGILAAAGLWALEHNVSRLSTDHAHARLLAEGLAAAGAEIDPDSVQTNIVIFQIADAHALVRRCAEAGVLLFALSPRTVRAVTHLDVSRQGIQRAVEVTTAAIQTASRDA